LLTLISFKAFLPRKARKKAQNWGAVELSNKRTFSLPPVLDFRITLEARNPARRCSRQYRVEAGTDLFGAWEVEISYGRIGTAGQSLSYVLRESRGLLTGGTSVALVSLAHPIGIAPMSHRPRASQLRIP
jgi:hypothetical protein